MRQRRRILLTALAAGIAAPRLAFGQAPKTPVVAVLFAGDSEDDEPALRPYFDELRRLGWEETRNIIFERLSGRGTREYVDALVQSAANLAPNLMFAATANIAVAAIKATDKVPVVFITASDPVAAGLVGSFAKPGRNATGVYQIVGELVSKRLELAREATGAKRMGLLVDRRSVEFQRQRTSHEEAARKLKIELAIEEFTNYEAVAKILAKYRRDGITVVKLTPSFSLYGRRREVGEAAERNKLALIGHRAEWAEAGALLTYGADIAQSLRASAAISDRILKGANPAAIPVERAARLELVLNQRTAKQLGITVPKALLQRVNRTFT